MEERAPIIDVHAHILPGIDDGSRSMEETLQLIQLSAEQGVTAIIATPHYSRRRENRGLRELAEEVRQQVRRWNPEFQIYLGQETYYHEELVERLRGGQGYTLADTRYVLVEFDTGTSYQNLYRGLRKLTGAGYVPVLAHMERYGCLREPGRVEELAGSGCWLQMNYESLVGHWFSREVRWCRKQVQDGWIHLLGTDMHRMDFRPPELAKAMEWMRGQLPQDRIADLTYRNASRILGSRHLERLPATGSHDENE